MISCLNLLSLVNCSAAAGKKDGYRPVWHNNVTHLNHMTISRRKRSGRWKIKTFSQAILEKLSLISKVMLWCSDAFINHIPILRPARSQENDKGFWEHLASIIWNICRWRGYVGEYHKMESIKNVLRYDVTQTGVRLYAVTTHFRM